MSDYPVQSGVRRSATSVEHYVTALDAYDEVAEAMSAWGRCMPGTEKDVAAAEKFRIAVRKLAEVES